MTVRVFAWPAALAAVTLAGLFVALLGDGAVNWMGDAALAVPLIVFVWAWRVRRC